MRIGALYFIVLVLTLPPRVPVLAEGVPGWLNRYPRESTIYRILDNKTYDRSMWHTPAGQIELEQAYSVALQNNDYESQLVILTTRSSISHPVNEYYSRLKYLRQSEEVARQLDPMNPVLGYFHRQAGITYQILELRERSLHHFKRQAAILKNAPEPEQEKLFKTYAHIARTYKALDQVDSAIIFNRKSITVTDHMADRLLQASSRNNAGYMFIEMGEYDKAWPYLDTAEAFVNTLDLQTYGAGGLKAAILDNRGMILQQRGKYEEALNLFQDCLQNLEGSTTKLRRAKIRYRIGWNLYRLGRIDEAYSYLNQAYDFISPLSLDRKRLNPKSYYLDLCQTLIEVARHRKDLERQNQVLNHLNELYFQKLNRVQEESLLSYRLIYEESNEFFDQKISAERARVRANRFLYLTIIVALLTVGLGVVFLLYRRVVRARSKREHEAWKRKLVEKELENNRLKQEQLNTSLDLKRKDLQDMSMAISMRQDIVRSLVGRLKKIQLMGPANGQAEIKSLILEINQQMSGDKQQEVLHQNIQDINAEFFANLEEAFPNLTKTEKTLCSLTRLHLSNKEIASLRNVSLSAVKLGKTRLRKKLALEPGADLGAFLEQF